MSARVDTITNEHVLEIRYRPNPRVLDHRGAWAQLISEHMGLKHWQIVENRLDSFSEKQVEHAFVGFRNAGYTAADTPTRNFFPERATKLLRLLFTLGDFGEDLFVERLGVRSRFCTPFSSSFEELVDLVARQYLTPTEAAREAVGAKAKLIDIGAPLNFADGLGNFNTTLGPMAAKQLSEFFRKDEGFPPVGLYYDIDYFVRPDRLLRGKEILSTVGTLADEAWDRHDSVRALVLGQ